MIGRVAIFTRNEADYHLLFPLIREVQARDSLALQLLVGGEHLSKAYGRTVAMIQSDAIPINRLLPVPLRDDMCLDAEQVGPATAVQIRRAIDELGPDLLLLVGGDAGAEGALSAAREKGVPVMLVHGMSGRPGDCHNHELAREAALHFVPGRTERDFLQGCGVQPERIVEVGALESDLVHMPETAATARDRLEHELDLPQGQLLILAAWQPDPEGWQNCHNALTAMLASFDQLPRCSIVFLGDRKDPEQLRIEVDAFIARNTARARLLVSPGRRRALSLLRVADIVVGNSDLGCLEAAACGTPSVQIARASPVAGSAQALAASADPDAIVSAIRTALAAGRKIPLRQQGETLADGRAAVRIADRLEALLGASPAFRFR